MIPVHCKHVYTLIKSLLTVVCCFSSSIGFAQSAAIQLTNRNLIFVGETLDVKVAVSEIKRKAPIVKTSNNLSYLKTDSTETILAKNRGVGTIHVGYVRKHDTIWVDSLFLRIKPYPKPILSYGTIKPGSTVPRIVAAIQKSIRLRYGYGIAPQPYWRVSSFRLTIVNSLGHQTFQCKGAGIPESASQVIRSTNGGRILVDMVRVTNNQDSLVRNLAPFVINLTPISDLDEIRYVNAVYRDNYQKYKRFDRVTDKHFIDTMFRDIDSGTMVLFGFDYRLERLYNNGVIQKKSHYDQYGRLQFTMKRVDEHIWDFEEVDSSGAIILNTTINDTLVLYGAKEIQIYLDSPWFKIRDSTKLEYDLIAFYDRYKLYPIGSFTTRYPDGTTRLAGNLKLREGTHIPWDIPRCGNIGIDELVNDVSVMDGSWILYGKDGKVIDRREYELGVSKKE